MDKEWDVNSEEYKAEVKKVEEAAVNEEIYAKLDELFFKWNRNEFRYKNDKNYAEYKAEYESYRDDLLLKLK